MRKVPLTILIIITFLVGLLTACNTQENQPVQQADKPVITVIGTSEITDPEVFATSQAIATEMVATPTHTPIATVAVDTSTNEGIIAACGDLPGTKLPAGPQKPGEFVELNAANTGNDAGTHIRTLSVIGDTVWGGHVGDTTAKSAAFAINTETNTIHPCGKAASHVIEGHINIIKSIINEVLIGLDGGEVPEVNGVVLASEQWVNKPNIGSNDNRVYDIAVVAEGGFWNYPEGTILRAVYNGIEVMYPMSDTWQLDNRMFNNGIQGNAPSLHALLLTEKGELWVVTQKVGIFIITMENGAYNTQRVNVANRQLESDAGRVVIELGGYRYVGSEGGLSRYEIETGEWQILNLPNKRVTGFATDDEGRLWLSTWGGTFYSEDNGITWVTYYTECETLAVAIVGNNVMLGTNGCSLQWGLKP